MVSKIALHPGPRIFRFKEAFALDLPFQGPLSQDLQIRGSVGCDAAPVGYDAATVGYNATPVSYNAFPFG